MSNNVGWWIGLALTVFTILLLIFNVIMLWEIRSDINKINKNFTEIECTITRMQAELNSMEWFLHTTPIIEKEYCGEKK